MEPAGPWHFEAETCKDGAGRYKQPSCTWSGGETDERVEPLARGVALNEIDRHQNRSRRKIENVGVVVVEVRFVI